METGHPDAIWADVPVCTVHKERYEPLCPDCDAEAQARNEVLGDLIKDAEVRMSSLARVGAPDPSFMMLGIRVGVLCDSIFMSNPRQMQQFEGEVGRRIVEEIKRTQKAILDHQIITPQTGLHVVRRNGKN